MERLIDIGESAIINSLIYGAFPHLKNSHDDAITLDMKNYLSVSLSTDPCPEPLICRFDEGNRYYHYGVMSVLINYSDLAATGVEPIGILLSTIMPNEMCIHEYSQFLQGVKDSCDAWGGNLLGGNVKDGKEFSVTGTAIGGQVNNNILTRIGSNVGDAVCIVGDPGVFWLAILKLLEGCSLNDLDDYTKSFVKSPYPKIKEGLLLSSSNIVTSCMDNSDGIIGCLYELAALNNSSIIIDDCKLFPNYRLEQFCKEHNIDYRNLMLSFGGWDLVFTCPMSEVTNLQRLFEKNNSKFHVIGKVTKRSEEKVMLVKDDFVYKINDFSSKRFNKHSYFSFGLEAFIEHFRKSQLNKLDIRRADL